ncbi:hypothetical protein BDW67DRAFT_150246 [Aspergillus spinulosporus]
MTSGPCPVHLKYLVFGRKKLAETGNELFFKSFSCSAGNLGWSLSATFALFWCFAVSLVRYRL